MSNHTVFAAGVIVGVALGMMYEHKRFLLELQGLSTQHKDNTPTDSGSKSNQT
jgi:hypothetical protein